MSISGIQGHVLDVSVILCSKLKDTEWISRQDPYVCLEYATTKCRTRTCTDGGRNPTFQEKFVFTLVEGLREIYVTVWNSNTISNDDFIGGGKVQLAKVLSQGYDDSSWSLQTKTGRHAGEVRLIMRYNNPKNECTHFAPVPPPCNNNTTQAMAQQMGYQMPPLNSSSYYPQPPPATAYPAASSHPPFPYPSPQHVHGSVYPPPPDFNTHQPPPQHHRQPGVYPPPPY